MALQRADSAEMRMVRWMQGSPVNVKHDARCAMDKVEARQKPQEVGILIYRYKSAVIS